MTKSDKSAVSDGSSLVQAKLQALQAKRHGWHIWLSRNQLLVAATLLDSSVGVSRTVIEYNFAQLDDALEQELKAAQRPRRKQLNPIRPL